MKQTQAAPQPTSAMQELVVPELCSADQEWCVRAGRFCFNTLGLCQEEIGPLDVPRPLVTILKHSNQNGSHPFMSLSLLRLLRHSLVLRWSLRWCLSIQYLQQAWLASHPASSRIQVYNGTKVEDLRSSSWSRLGVRRREMTLSSWQV